MIEIRRAALGDHQRLAAIAHECWSTSNDPGEHWQLDRPFIGSPTNARVDGVFVATSSFDPIGYVRSHAGTSPYGEWYIAGLGVALHAQSRGAGRALVLAALEAAASNGRSGVWLKVLSTNGAGLALYKSLGFNEVARFPNAFANRPGVDDLRLSIRL